MILTIGSRASALARWQAEWVKARLSAAGHEVRIAFIRTTGDREPGATLPSSGVKGLFIKEIEEALLAREVDLAVHSLKDVPTALPDGLALGAVPEREDPRDVLVVGAGLKPALTPPQGAFATFPPGARLGTSSLRRESQLRALRGDLEIARIRGNVDTRLRKLDEGQVDGLVLAAAGLKRLGLEGRISQYFGVEQICPAVGQGALAIEIRKDDGKVAEAVRGLVHHPTRSAVRAERAALAALGGGCDLPFAAYAHVEGGQLDLRGIVAALDGSKVIRAECAGPAGDPESLGAQLASNLEKQGARELLASGEQVRPD
jgi:hydroxymethylbilane synthase